jgi:hypothetical protein
MIRKDFIDAEIAKLNQVIARIIGLKDDGNLDEAWKLSGETLLETFRLDRETLESGSIEGFGENIKNAGYSAEHLNALAQLLFENAHPFQETEEHINMVRKTALVLNLLETEHHQQSLENLSRRKMIDNFLSNVQYE